MAYVGGGLVSTLPREMASTRPCEEFYRPLFMLKSLVGLVKLFKIRNPNRGCSPPDKGDEGGLNPTNPSISPYQGRHFVLP